MAVAVGTGSDYTFPNDDEYDDDGGDDDDDGTHYVDDVKSAGVGRGHHRFLSEATTDVGLSATQGPPTLTLDLGILLPLQGPTCVRGAELYEAMLVANVRVGLRGEGRGVRPFFE
jgi:hypothetical protein